MNVPRVRVPMTMSGYCAHPSTPEHAGCERVSCTCTDCHHTTNGTKMPSERKQCARPDTHIGHEWGIGYADMGTVWYECPGIDWMFAPYSNARIDPGPTT